MKERVLLVSPRYPRRDGRGDQRRAWEIQQALKGESEVEVLSWLPELDLPRWSRWLEHPVGLARTALLSVRQPMTVSYAQGHMPRRVRRRLAERRDEVRVFVTNRAAPRVLPASALVDFVDDLGGSSLARAESSRGWLRPFFWRSEGRRIQTFDRRLARTAAVAVAHSPADAEAIAPNVVTIRLSAVTAPTPDEGNKVVFVGNLFYLPNHEAAHWMCTSLVPTLASMGVDAQTIVIAGRKPRASLKDAAAQAGIDLRPDVDDLAAIFHEAAVVLAPMALGVGALYKIIDAVGASRACILSPLANTGLGLIDGDSALIRDRDPTANAEAIVSLLSDPARRHQLAQSARTQLADSMPEFVAAQWRAAVTRAAGGMQR